MLTPSDVQFAFELMLGRKETRPQRIEQLVRNCDSVPKLRNHLLAMKEVRKRLGEGEQDRKLLTSGAMPVQVDVPPEAMERLLAHVESTWRGFGETEPHWSVLTNQRFTSENLEQNRDDFYGTGEREIRHLRQAITRAGKDVGALRSCLELGCGVGRVTVWLATMFEEVVGTDISQPHLSLADDACRERGLMNVAFQRVATREEIARLPEADAFFSVITLQHSPPPVMAMILDACLRRLRMGGVGYFQLPVAVTGYQFAVDEFLEQGLKPEARTRSVTQEAGMEHHCLPQPDLFRVIERAGCRVLDIQDDTFSRPNKLSNTVLVEKVRAV